MPVWVISKIKIIITQRENDVKFGLFRGDFGFYPVIRTVLRGFYGGGGHLIPLALEVGGGLTGEASGECKTLLHLLFKIF